MRLSVDRLAAFCCLLLAVAAPAVAAPPPKPNVVLIFCDDLGWGDVGVYGATNYKTPHLDRLAAEGIKFNDFYCAQAVCSASRAGLLTGCYPNRVGILGALGPKSQIAIHENELLIPELLRGQGYATAIYGKWHLGQREPFLPLQHGFDEYFGLPYSNDMWPLHPSAGPDYPDLPLFEGNAIANPKVTAADQRQLTTWYTERAVKFIRAQKDGPFFVYLPHSMPHVPLHVSDKFAGKSEQGLFGDVLMEIDWSVGQVLATLEELGLDEKTLVIFTSDNGPWLSYGPHAGSAGPLREGKGTAWDGGQRVPCLMRWPGQIPAGQVCNELAATIDLLPTLVTLAGGGLPNDRVLDGRDIWPLMAGEPGAKTPHESFYFYWGNELHAVRNRDWKLHLPHEYRTLDGRPGRNGSPGPYKQTKTELALFNLREDVGERYNVADLHPEVVAQLMQHVEAARADLGDELTQRVGTRRRPAGRVGEGR
ncbi:MAG: sulfatase [Pirellulales bacterium]